MTSRHYISHYLFTCLGCHSVGYPWMWLGAPCQSRECVCWTWVEKCERASLACRSNASFCYLLLLSHQPLFVSFTCILGNKTSRWRLHPAQRTWNSSRATLKRTETQTEGKKNWSVSCFIPFCCQTAAWWGAEERHLSCRLGKQHRQLVTDSTSSA